MMLNADVAEAEKILDEAPLADLAASEYVNIPVANERLGAYAKSFPGIYDTTRWSDDPADPYRHIGAIFLSGKAAPEVTTASLRKFYDEFAARSVGSGGEVFIDFMEHTLSEHGVYAIWWNPTTDKARLTFSYAEDVKFDSLDEAVAYVAVYHPYQRPEGHEECGDL